MTILSYLSNPHLFESDAIFLEAKTNEKGNAIIFDRTIFHPQGGGQPSDTGEITSENGTFSVTDVRIDEEGTAWHYGNFKNGTFHKDEKVHLQIDKDRRIVNTKLHSAGHLLDCAVEKLGLLGTIKPGKAFQFPPTPYVEYEGMLENAADYTPSIEKTVNELIEANIPVETEMLSQEEVTKRGLYVPKGKPARVVRFKGFADSGCGGTHVTYSSEIGKIQITKIKSKDGLTRIHFLVN